MSGNRRSLTLRVPFGRGDSRPMILRGSVPAGVPVVDADLYADEVLRDSGELFKPIRDVGPVVWLPRHGMFAMGRFADVRAALRNDGLFRSGDGVAANPITNALSEGTTLNSDDDEHTTRRRVLMRSLGAKAIVSVEQPLAREASAVVAELAGGPTFEAPRDFSGGSRPGSCPSSSAYRAAASGCCGGLRRRLTRWDRSTAGAYAVCA